MKNKINAFSPAICMIIVFQSAFITEPLQSQALDGYHTRTGVFGNPPEQYKFRDTPDDVGFLTEFPWEAIYKEINETDLDSIEIEYWIYTSVSDAEMAMVETLDMSSLLLRNMIDYPLTNGFIGDNCWHSIELTGSIIFIRYNELIFIKPKVHGQFDSKIIEQTARKIDSVLTNSETVSDSTEIPCPVINSVTIISSLAQNMDDVVDIKIDAIDLNGKQLYYRKYATGYAIVSETGILTISFNENTDLTDDTTRARVKIWVWNEDHFVSSAEEYIPFLITSAVQSQGPTVEVLREALYLMQNYPNPFSASTIISYKLTGSFETNVKIYDLTGREIVTIANGFQPAGIYQLIWNGKDSKGLSVPSGIYFCCLEAGSVVKIKKMILQH